MKKCCRGILCYFFIFFQSLQLSLLDFVVDVRLFVDSFFFFSLLLFFFLRIHMISRNRIYPLGLG